MGHYNRQELVAESWYLLRLLSDLDVPVIFLKGAAYALADLDVAKGRMATDIDILVPEDAIGDVEARLQQAGWASMKTNEYDDSYYRQWMHEIPPPAPHGPQPRDRCSSYHSAQDLPHHP